MDELMIDEMTLGFKDYRHFKETLDTELKANVEGFVKIGWLLKVARDTDILRESGHKNVAEFAAAEYGLTKDVVSRYIAINDRYSEGGYSSRLQLKYEGFGVSKLQEMLTLPDSIIEEITPTLTRQQIQAIKKEVAAEEKITPIEVAMEAAAPEVQKEEKELTFSLRVWKQYFSADTTELEIEKFMRLSCPYFESILTDDSQVKAAKEKFFDVFGDRVVWSRVPGIGRIMISVSGEADDRIVFTNSRTGEKQEFKSIDVLQDIRELIDAKGCYREVFEEYFRGGKKEEPKPAEPEKEEVAPVQQAEPTENFMPEPEPEQIIEKNVQNTKENVQNTEENVQITPKNIQGEVENEKERSKEEPECRTDGNENREKVEAADGGSDTKESIKRLGKLEVGDIIVNIKDGTRGTMLGYCAGEYKISTENGLTLVNENSITWKKEEVVDAEYREAEEGKADNDRSGELGEEGSRTEESHHENDNVVSAETEQITAEASGLANEKDFKDKISSIKDSAETISIICSELLANSYDADNIDKILEAVSKMTEKIASLTEEWHNNRESVADGHD